MGEIIDFPGSGEEKKEEVILNKAKVTLLLGALTSLFRDNPNLKNNIPSRMEYLKNSSDNDLIRIINLSNENEWSQRPAYFAAIIDILRSNEIL